MKKNIKDEWLNFFSLEAAKKITPKDSFNYKISEKVINTTGKILKQYGNLTPSNEGFVYWAGTIKNIEITINTVIIPETDSDEQRVTVMPEFNFYVVKSLSENKLVQIGQVHSHPGSWVDHSYGDNEWASFKREGLISIVVPNYCNIGLLPLTTCGVHRFNKQKFIRLSEKYIEKHFKIVKGECKIIDLRDKNNIRWTK